MIMQKISLFIIKIGRTLAKNLKLENNSLILAIHKIILSLGFPENESVIQIDLYDHHFQMNRDLSMLPGLLNGTYEKFERKFLANTLKAGDTFIDVGGNFGLYSVLASSLVGPRGKVMAFEPVPQTFNHLKTNLQPFIQSEAFNMAVGEKNGEISIFFDPQRPGCSTAFPGHGDPVVAQMIVLDSFLASKNISKVNFIKIDVEGLEHEVLMGTFKCLDANTIVLSEFNAQFLTEKGRDPDEFLDYVKTRFASIEFICDVTGSIKKISKSIDLNGQIVANLILKNPIL